MTDDKLPRPYREERTTPELPWVDDNTLASRVQAAWNARLTAPDDMTIDRQMAVIAVNTILNALSESGHLV